MVLALHFLFSGFPVCDVFNVKKHIKVCFSGILSMYKGLGLGHLAYIVY